LGIPWDQYLNFIDRSNYLNPCREKEDKTEEKLKNVGTNLARIFFPDYGRMPHSFYGHGEIKNRKEKNKLKIKN
jgi:hypothetical protein